MADRPSKRVKLEQGQSGADPDPPNVRAQRAKFLDSVSRPVSPPGLGRSGNNGPSQGQDRPQYKEAIDKSGENSFSGTKKDEPPREPANSSTTLQSKSNLVNRAAEIPEAKLAPSEIVLRPSPFQLTHIRDLPSSENVHAITLHDILGDPLIKEAWVFNFCFDVDWLMTHFDSDARSMVAVKIVHGSWRAEDRNRLRIEDACRRWSNVEAFSAYLPDAFGTHHSKMFILFTHDDQAQVIIHTANILEQDWTNMTQAVWQSPRLPKSTRLEDSAPGRPGGGSRFKHDLLLYLKAYGSKAKSLRDQLISFDFSRVRGALVASVPSEMPNAIALNDDSSRLWERPLWGYLSLWRVLKEIAESKSPSGADGSHVVCQISSIATLSPVWLNTFFSVLTSSAASPSKTSEVSIIYPTPHNVSRSLDGYASGGSIHTKAQSPAHIKQITSLRNHLCQWTKGPLPNTSAGRDEAAPHIKTYISFRQRPTTAVPEPDINWALLTSANLSTQAWGTVSAQGKTKKDANKEIKVQSFEIGVLVWPELFSDDFDPERQVASKSTSRERQGKIKMVPTFKKDMPRTEGRIVEEDKTIRTQTFVGLRMPYDLPLTPYTKDEMPWSPQGSYDTRDRNGRRWPRDFV